MGGYMSAYWYSMISVTRVQIAQINSQVAGYDFGIALFKLTLDALPADVTTWTDVQRQDWADTTLAIRMAEQSRASLIQQRSVLETQLAYYVWMYALAGP